MRAKFLQLLVISLIFGCVVGVWTGNTGWAQEETPTETPTATPVPPAETPTETPPPQDTPTNTPVPQPETPTDTPQPSEPTETPTDTPVPPTNTPTTPPVETPTPTPEPAEPLRMSVEGVTVQVGETVSVAINVENADNIDAFSFDVFAPVTAEGALAFEGLDLAGTLVEDFLNVQSNIIPMAGSLRVRVAGIGGAESASGDGNLVKLLYSGQSAGSVEITVSELVDDVEGAEVESGVVTVEPAVETPTETPVPPTPETPTDTPVPPPTPETPTDTPVPPTFTPTVPPTETGTVTPRPTLPVFTPTPLPTATPLPPTPTAFVINPELGMVAYDRLGGAHARGAAVHNFDVGLSVLDPASPFFGQLFARGIYDGRMDPDAFGPFLAFEITDEQQGIQIDFMPIAQDLEFTGEILPSDEGGTGTEGVFFLIGGNIGPLAPVHARLGAGISRPEPDTGGVAFGGGIDTNNDPADNIDFGAFRGDIVPVGYDPALGETIEAFESPLTDVEPAGNSGFYALNKNGRIYAEGDANEELDHQFTLSDGVTAVNLEIYRGTVSDTDEYSWSVTTNNSKYSENLIGVAAYVLDSAGVIHRYPESAPEPVVENLPADNAFGYKDIEFVPSPDGARMMGLAVLTGDGMVHFAPFSADDNTEDNIQFVADITPFGDLALGFPFDIARDIEVEIRGSEVTFYGLNDQGETVEFEDVKIGSFVFDGFGGTHVGGQSTRFAFAPVEGGDWVVDGQPSVPIEVVSPYFVNSDFMVDGELSWPLDPPHINPNP